MRHAYWAATCPNSECRATIIICEIGPVQKGWEESALRPESAEGDCRNCHHHHNFAGPELWVSIRSYRLEPPVDPPVP